MRNRNLLPTHIWSLTSKHRGTSVRTATADRPHLHPRRLFVTVNDAVAFIVFYSECKTMSSCVFCSASRLSGKKSVSAVCLFMPDRRRDAEYFCRCVVMETNICLSALSTATMMSHGLALGVMRRLPVILTVLHYQIQTIQAAIMK